MRDSITSLFYVGGSFSFDRSVAVSQLQSFELGFGLGFHWVVFSINRSGTVSLLRLFLVRASPILCSSFVLSLRFPRLFFKWCLGKGDLRACGISLVFNLYLSYI